MSEKSRWPGWVALVVFLDLATEVFVPILPHTVPRISWEWFLGSIPALLAGPVLMTRYRPELRSERLAAYAAMASSLLILYVQLKANHLPALFLGR